MAKDKSIPSNIVLAKEKFKYDTIQDMVNDITLKVGMVVDINGYYKPDDGATHKRVIADTDDGSGVQLRSGKWANIVHEGNILITWFGAKGDNSYNNNKEFKRFFDYMKLNPFNKFIIPEGKFMCNSWYHLPSNIVLEINGDILADSNYGFVIATYDGVNEYPGYTGTHDTTICGKGTIDLRGHIYHDSQNVPLRIYHGRNLTIKDITLKNCVDFHFIELASENVLIQNVKFKGQFYTGALNTCNLECIQLEFCIENGSGMAIPYDMTPAKNIVIDGCYFGESEEGGKMYSAIGDHSGYDVLVSNIVIKNCIFDKVDGSGTKHQKFLGFLYKMDNLQIYNNTFINCAGQILLKTQAKKDIVIKDNIFDTISNNIFMFLENINNCNISNNIFRNIKGISIYTLDNCNNIIISDNIFQNCSLENEELKTDNSPIIMVAKVMSGLVVNNNTFISKSNYVKRPFHMPSNIYETIETIEFKNNSINMNAVAISDYLRATTKNYDILFKGNKYYGEIFSGKDIRFFEKLEIIYKFQNCQFTHTEILSHIKVGTYPQIQNSITIRNFNLDDTTPDFSLVEALISLTNESMNITNNSRIYKNNLTSKKDDVSDSAYISIIEIRGYHSSNNRIVLNPALTVLKAMANLKPEMEKENVYNDYLTYLNDLGSYEDYQKEQGEQKQLAYEEALKENPELTYEEFMSVQPMTLNLVEEPRPTSALQKFMDKYL